MDDVTRRGLQDDLQLIVDHESKLHFVPGDVVDAFKRMHPEVMVHSWVYLVEPGRHTFRIDIFEPTYNRTIEVVW